MSRRLTGRDVENRAKAKRVSALSRGELRYPTEPRAPAQGVTAMAVKTIDPAVRKMIEEFERARHAGCAQEKTRFTTAPESG